MSSMSFADTSAYLGRDKHANVIRKDIVVNGPDRLEYFKKEYPDLAWLEAKEGTAEYALEPIKKVADDPCKAK